MPLLNHCIKNQPPFPIVESESCQ